MEKIKKIGGSLNFDKNRNSVRFEVNVDSLTISEVKEQNPHLTDEQANEVLALLINMREIEKRSEDRFSDTVQQR